MSSFASSSSSNARAGPSYSYQYQAPTSSTSNSSSNVQAQPLPRKLSPGSGVLQLSSPAHASSSRTFPAPGSPNDLTTRHMGRAGFSTLSAAYPLKLLSPSPLPSQPPSLALVYTLAYGGGLVAGDLISLRGVVEEGCGLVMLTQGSTKVYKRRPGLRPMSHSVRQKQTPNRSRGQAQNSAPGQSTSTPSTSTSTSHAVSASTLLPGGPDSGSSSGSGSDVTRQRLHLTLRPHSLLLLLPDSISPFARSQYSQVQRFVLPADGTASALILDWVNSGRGQKASTSRGISPAQAGDAAVKDTGGTQDRHNAIVMAEEEEIWSMDIYGSTNEVFVGDRCVMRERMVLDNRLFDSPAAPAADATHSSSSERHDGNGNPNPKPVLNLKTTPTCRPNQSNNGNDKSPPTPTPTPTPTTSSSLSNTAKNLAPYNIYATVLFLGPKLIKLLNYLKDIADKMRQFQLKSPPGLVWSFSEVDPIISPGPNGSASASGTSTGTGSGQGAGVEIGTGAGVIRIAAVETEAVRIWLRSVLEMGGVDELVGEGLWPRII